MSVNILINVELILPCRVMKNATLRTAKPFRFALNYHTSPRAKRNTPDDSNQRYEYDVHGDFHYVGCEKKLTTLLAQLPFVVLQCGVSNQGLAQNLRRNWRAVRLSEASNRANHLYAIQVQ